MAVYDFCASAGTYAVMYSWAVVVLVRVSRGWSRRRQCVMARQGPFVLLLVGVACGDTRAVRLQHMLHSQKCGHVWMCNFVDPSSPGLPGYFNRPAAVERRHTRHRVLLRACRGG